MCVMTPLLRESSSLPLGKFWRGRSDRSQAWLSPPRELRNITSNCNTHFSSSRSIKPHIHTHTSYAMADNVGLTTPRGSGTSGYVQKNRSLLRPRDKVAPYPKDYDHAKHRPRQPDAEILEHEAKRDIEVKVFELRDKLEEEG